MELGEELGVEDVDFGLERPRDHVVLQEAQVEKDQYIVEIDTRFEKLKVFLADRDVAIVLSVDQFADHVVFLDFGKFVAVIIYTRVVVNEAGHIGR